MNAKVVLKENNVCVKDADGEADKKGTTTKNILKYDAEKETQEVKKKKKKGALHVDHCEPELTDGGKPIKSAV